MSNDVEASRVKKQLKTLGLTGVETSQLGIGCATLFHLPLPSDRRAVLETAFTHGITHFDVAPMYGLGLAEPEVGSFLKGRRNEATITTKFGIEPTVLALTAARMQRPVREALRRLPRTSQSLKSSGRGPASGIIGRLLYSSHPYTAAEVRRSLERSLSLLKTEYVDVFLIHDPTNALLFSNPELIDYLSSEVIAGRIRTWGSAVDIIQPLGEVRRLLESSPVIQIRDDIFERRPRSATALSQGTITFGIMERTLPMLSSYLRSSNSERLSWSDRFGFDVLGRDALAHLLLRQAIRRNRSGPVLFSSTRFDRVRDAAIVASATRDSREILAEADVLDDLIAAALRDQHEASSS